jgi:hypothetical protein
MNLKLLFPLILIAIGAYAAGYLFVAFGTEGGPDEACLYDTSLAKCTPGPEGCLEGFGTNDEGQCFPLHDRCPDGYHGHEDDESGECIPDSIPCEEGYIMNLSFPSCERKDFVCQEYPNLDECKITVEGNLTTTT